MVNTQTKSGIQKEETSIRVPPKRGFSETVGGNQNLLTPGQQIVGKDTVRGGQRRKPNPSPATLDAKSMIKMVPTLSERELKQLVNTIIRRRRKEEGARNKRPSEPASERGTTAVLLPPRAPAEATETKMPPMSEDQANGGNQVGRTMQEAPKRAVEPDLAGALLRQANRYSLSSRYFYIPKICNILITLFAWVLSTYQSTIGHIFSDHLLVILHPFIGIFGLYVPLYYSIITFIVLFIKPSSTVK